MSDYHDQHPEPTPEMEAFYHQRFAEWDEEKARREAEQPLETTDEKGNRVVTFRAAARRRSRERVLQLPVDEEEDALEAMLEANSNKSKKLTFFPKRPREPEPEEPVGKEPVRDDLVLTEPVSQELIEQAQAEGPEKDTPEPAPEEMPEDMPEPAPEEMPEDAPEALPITPAELLQWKGEGEQPPSAMIRRSAARAAEERERSVARQGLRGPQAPLTPAEAVEQAAAEPPRAPEPAPVKLHGEQFLTIPLRSRTSAPVKLNGEQVISIPLPSRQEDSTPTSPQEKESEESPLPREEQSPGADGPDAPSRSRPAPAREKEGQEPAAPEGGDDAAEQEPRPGFLKRLLSRFARRRQEAEEVEEVDEVEETDETDEDELPGEEEGEPEEESPEKPRLGRLGRWMNAWFEERIEEQGRQISADAEYEQEHLEEVEAHTTRLHLPVWKKKGKAAQPARPPEPSEEEAREQTPPPAPAEQVPPPAPEERPPAPAERPPVQQEPPRRLRKALVSIQLEPGGEEPEEPEEPAQPAPRQPRPAPGPAVPPRQAGEQAVPVEPAGAPAPSKPKKPARRAAEKSGTPGGARTAKVPEQSPKPVKPGEAARPKEPVKPGEAARPKEPPKSRETVRPGGPARATEQKPGTKRPQKARTEKIIRMPEERTGALEQKLNHLKEHADDFADAMFVGESAETLREEKRHRAVAKLIPATDEEGKPRPRDIAREERRQRAQERQVHAPDTSPRELFRVYGASFKSQRGRLPLQLLTAAAVLLLSAVAGGELPFVQVPVLRENVRLTGLLLTLGLLLSCVVGLDTLLEGLIRLLRGRPGLSTLSSVGVALAIADGLWYSLVGREGPLPFCGFAALSLWAMAFGAVRKKQGLRDACEDAYTRSEFERLTMDAGKWSGKGVYEKEPGPAKGFGSQIQELDGVERVYRYAAPVMMAACAAFGVLSAVGQQSAHMLLWNWSVIFVLATPLSATLAYGLPYARQVKRLRRSGAVLAGWDGVESLRGDAGIVLTDRDLFPDGSAQFLGIQNFGDVSLEKLTGCTASMVREADLGLSRIFHDQIRIQGGFYRRVDNLDTSEEGGFTGVIRGDTVMIGTSGFLRVHGIRIEPGYQVKNAIFCAVNGRLQGSFALSYTLPRAVPSAIQALLQGGITPILATRDFNIHPDMLRQRFKLPSERMQYPDVNRRFDLSAKGQPHNHTLGALIFREGMVPYVDAILGAKRLYHVVRLNTLLTLAASAVGGLLGLYLTWVHAYQSLSLMNTLFFLLMWLVPTLLISRGVDQF